MKYKKQIIFICLLTFLLLPFNCSYADTREVNTYNVGSITGDLVSTGLGVAASTVVFPVLSNLAIALGVSYLSYEAGKCVKEFIATKGIPYFEDKIGSFIDGQVEKYAVSSSLVEEFNSYLHENVTISGNGYKTIKIYDGFPSGTFKVPYGRSFEINYNSGVAQSRIGHSCFVCSTLGYYYLKIYSVKNTSISSEARLSVYHADGTLSTDGGYMYYKSNNYCTLYECSDVSVSDTPTLWDIPFDNTKGDVIVSNPPSDTDISGGVAVPEDGFWGGVEQGQLTTDGIVVPYPGVSSDTDTGVIDKPNIDVGETPTTGDSLWDTLLSWLSSLFAPLVALLEWIGSILTSILDFLGSLVSSLVDAIVSLFAPTVAVDELFSIPEGSGFSDILSLFDWGLFDIEPKPYEFVATLDFMSLVDNTSNPQVIEIKLFDNELVKKYLPYVRNILSYSLLISTISMIVWHFIPKRDID